jgi:hypothetical protein
MAGHLVGDEMTVSARRSRSISRSLILTAAASTTCDISGGTGNMGRLRAYGGPRENAPVREANQVRIEHQWADLALTFD